VNEDSDSSEDLDEASSYDYHLVGSEPAALHQEDEENQDDEEEDDISGLSMADQVGTGTLEPPPPPPPLPPAPHSPHNKMSALPVFHKATFKTVFTGTVYKRKEPIAE
jgi:hypothetical protein